MFNATYFRYDGTSSQNYGLQIVDFDDGAVKETDAFSPTLSLQKVPGAVRFFHGGIEYDSAPTCEFSVVSEQELTPAIRRTLLSWLVGRKQFKALQFIGGDNSDFTYYCVFTSARTIWINGRCHGLRLTAQFDSPFARGTATIATAASGTSTIQIENKSDIVDGYVYPIVQFTGGSIDIVNTTDDSQRHFTFSGLTSSEVITVDNEVRHISSTIGGEKLSKFTSKNWLRLRPGVNSLRITAAGAVTITCPYYAMIGY